MCFRNIMLLTRHHVHIQIFIISSFICPFHAYTIRANNGAYDKATLDSLHRRDVMKRAVVAFSGLASGALNVEMVVAQAAELETTDDSLSVPVIGKKKFATPKKPSAPAPALLPAARVKYTIEESLRLLDELESMQARGEYSSKTFIGEIIFQLKSLIGVKSYMSPLLSANSANGKAVSIDEAIMKPSKSKLYQDTYNQKLKEMPPLDIPLSLLTKAGDYRQFDLLQKRQRKLEKLNPIREAFNYYTRQLEFDTEYYLLTASADEKKRMIRNDALPDIKSVIVSDLDLRDLVRNQVLDAFDDVKFELEYQIKNYESVDSFDAREMRSVLTRAIKECNEWFSFIADDDVEKAMATVANE